MDFFEKLHLAGLVPVIAIDNPEDAVPLCRALSEGGLPVAEITFRTDAAEESIRRVHEELPEVLLCAGTVLTCEQADRAVKAGAAAIVSPGLNPQVVRHCQELGVSVCPGTANPSDVETALSLGLHTVKFFPAEALGGLKVIKAMCAAYRDISFMPTGGINPDNMLDYLAYDKVLCCGGSWIVPKDAVVAKDWSRITALTRAAVDKMLGLSICHIGINSGTSEAALRDAQAFARLMGWNVREFPVCFFAGDGIECVKAKFKGERGHIGISCNNLARAKWHLEQRGYTFDDMAEALIRDGKVGALYMKEEIAGFAIHLSEK